MDINTQKRLNRYLELLEEISEKTNEESTAVALLHEIAKDTRAEQMRNERQTRNGNGATSKQKRLMKQLGLDFPETISRKEASVMITEELDRVHEAGE